MSVCYVHSVIQPTVCYECLMCLQGQPTVKLLGGLLVFFCQLDNTSNSIQNFDIFTWHILPEQVHICKAHKICLRETASIRQRPAYKTTPYLVNIYNQGVCFLWVFTSEHTIEHSLSQCDCKAIQFQIEVMHDECIKCFYNRTHSQKRERKLHHAKWRKAADWRAEVSVNQFLRKLNLNINVNLKLEEEMR